MSWIRVDDHLADHPKLVSLGDFAPLALALQIRALCWSSRYLTDGKIPAEAVPLLLGGFGAWGIETAGVPGMFAMGSNADEFDWPAMMVRVGLWETTTGGGYLIHDYLEYNPSRVQVLAGREAARERMQKQRGGSTGVRQNIHRTSSEVQEAPAPTPTPTPKESKTKSKSNAISHTPTDTQFDLAWAQYPKRGGSNPRVDAERSWRARLTEGIPPDVMLAGTARYAKFCEKTGKLGSEYVMQARRFYGPAHPFEESWAIPVDPDAWKHDPTEFRPGESQEAYIRRTSEGNGR